MKNSHPIIMAPDRIIHSLTSKLRYLLCVISCVYFSSCVANDNPPVQSNRMLSQYMLAEIALKRQQNDQAYQAIDNIINADTDNDTFAQLVSLLKAKKHADYRYQVVTRWAQQHPDDSLAVTQLAKEQVCRKDTAHVDTAVKALQLADSQATIKTISRCLGPEETITLLSDVIAKDSSLASAQLYRCTELRDVQQYAEALECFEGIGAIEDPEALRLLADLYAKNGRVQDARNTYERLLVQAPQDDNSRYELAGIYYDSGQFRSAIDELLILNKRAPKNRNVHYLLAASYYSLKQFEESRFWFEETLFSKQYRNRAFYYLGLIALEMKQPERAKRYFSSVEESEEYLPAQINYWRLVAKDDLNAAIHGLYDLQQELPNDRMTIRLVEIDLYNEADDKQRATQELVSLADDYPNHLRLQILRIQWLIDRNYIRTISANLRASLSGLRDIEKQKQLVNSTIYYLMEQHYGSEAVKILDEQDVIVAGTDEYKMLDGLSNAIAENFPEAVSILDELLIKYPDRHDIQNALGYTLTLQGKDFNRAEQLLFSALKSQPDNAAYLDSLGWLRFNQGNFSEAEQLLSKANSLSNDPAIKAHLVEVYLAQSRRDDALALLRDALQSFPDNNVLKKLDAVLTRSGDTLAND